MGILDITLLVVIGVLVLGAVISMIRKKKSGGSGCGGCSGCDGCDTSKKE